MAKKQCTVNELAESLSVDYPTANALLKIMVDQKAADIVGRRPNASGKGKSSTIYEVPESFTVKLF